jgi:hypothetical protein
MRLIEKMMVAAVNDRHTLINGNTAVYFSNGTIYGPRSEVSLHGNNIAYVYHDTGKVAVNTYTLSKWPTATTKSRLRALGVKVTTKQGIIYINGKTLTEAISEGAA